MNVDWITGCESGRNSVRSVQQAEQHWVFPFPQWILFFRGRRPARSVFCCCVCLVYVVSPFREGSSGCCSSPPGPARPGRTFPLLAFVHVGLQTPACCPERVSAASLCWTSLAPFSSVFWVFTTATFYSSGSVSPLFSVLPTANGCNKQLAGEQICAFSS